MIWHSTSAAEVLSELGVDDKRGLPNGVAEMRLQQYGKNVISSIEKPSYLKRFSEQLKNRMVIFLLVTAVVSFIVSLMYGQVNNYSPLLIIGIVIANAAVSAYQLHNCDNALDSMKSYTLSLIHICRGYKKICKRIAAKSVCLRIAVFYKGSG